VTPPLETAVTESRNRDVLLAFDFGVRRLGIATGNLHTRTATPLTTLAVGRDLPWSRLDTVVAEWQPGMLIVGMPQASNSPSSVRAKVRRFVAALAERYRLPVETVDESLTSSAASAELREGRRSGSIPRRLRKTSIDRYAACHIAEQWMSATHDAARRHHE
jgi:putative Holliday junction resolvase